MTIAAFVAMGAGILGVIATLPLGSFWLFLLGFLVLFAAAGIGNGATYRMIPTVFALRAREKGGDGVGAQRTSAAALGLVSAIGAYGGFVIPSCWATRRPPSATTRRRWAGSSAPTR